MDWLLVHVAKHFILWKNMGLHMHMHPCRLFLLGDWWGICHVCFECILIYIYIYSNQTTCAFVYLSISFHCVGGWENETRSRNKDYNAEVERVRDHLWLAWKRKVAYLLGHETNKWSFSAHLNEKKQHW